MTERLPLLSPAQYRLPPLGASGQRVVSGAPPSGSILMTSAPSWASVIPPSGAATKEETSMIRSPASGPSSESMSPLCTSALAGLPARADDALG